MNTVKHYEDLGLVFVEGDHNEECEPLKAQRDIEIDMIGELINKYNSGECSVGDLHEYFRVTKVEK